MNLHAQYKFDEVKDLKGEGTYGLVYKATDKKTG